MNVCFLDLKDMRIGLVVVAEVVCVEHDHCEYVSAPLAHPPSRAGVLAERVLEPWQHLCEERHKVSRAPRHGLVVYGVNKIAHMCQATQKLGVVSKNAGGHPARDFPKFHGVICVDERYARVDPSIDWQQRLTRWHCRAVRRKESRKSVPRLPPPLPNTSSNTSMCCK